MSWKELYSFTLNPSIMCVGQPGFKAYIPEQLQFGLQQGKYRIKYVSGAVKSYNADRNKEFLPKYAQFLTTSNSSLKQYAGKYYQSNINKWSLSVDDENLYVYLKKEDDKLNFIYNQILSSTNLYFTGQTEDTNKIFLSTLLSENTGLSLLSGSDQVLSSVTTDIRITSVPQEFSDVQQDITGLYIRSDDLSTWISTNSNAQFTPFITRISQNNYKLTYSKDYKTQLNAISANIYVDTNSSVSAKFISTYEFKWNKYYPVDNNISNLVDIDFTNFPQMKYNVFQCRFGTLPGFTSIGANTKQMAYQFGHIDLLPEEIYKLVKQDVDPLEFQLNKKTNISFWYVDNCAPCVEGDITYVIQKETFVPQLYVNTFGVLSFNINTLETEVPEYYGIKDDVVINQTDETFIDQYINIQNALSADSQSNAYMISLQDYNTFGYNKNAYNQNNYSMYMTYKSSYATKYLPDIYWALTSQKSYSKFDLVADISPYQQLPLFPGTYTLIPKDKLLLSGTIFRSPNYHKQIKNVQEYVFVLSATTYVEFNCNAYLYSGQITQQQLINSFAEINTNVDLSQLVNSSNMKKRIATSQKIKDENIINGDFYVYFQYTVASDNENDTYFNPEFMQIVSNVDQNLLLQESSSSKLYGPFKSIEQAEQMIIKYCLFNNLQYYKISDILYSIGIQRNVE